VRRPILLATVLAMAFVAGSQEATTADEPEVVRDEPGPGVLRVGRDRDLKRPSAAAKIARDGDVIEIDAGTYDGDAAVWRANKLTLRGVGGRAHLRARGASAEDKATWVVKGDDTTIEGVEFSGAKASPGNGAGIRLEGAGLKVRNCYFHDNENGILTGANPASDVVVEHSEFAHNGSGDGYTHNLYIGAVKSFTLRFSYVHHAVGGHNVKTRALTSYVTYNRIMDEKDGKSSYSLEFPDGGLAFVVGNVIQQGPAAENGTIVSYGAEKLAHPLNELYFVNNTVVNDLPQQGRFVFVKPGVETVKMANNVFSGPGEVPAGASEPDGNVVLAKRDFVNAGAFDYRLRAGAAAIGRGVDPGSAHGFELRPTAEYTRDAQENVRPRSRNADAGALEYRREP
jgi:hypothetical protein